MSVTFTHLKNGLPVIMAKASGTQTATALIIYRTGSKHESKKQGGLSHFVEHMMFKGTKLRPNTLMISSELDALGGQYNAFTSKEYTGYFVKVAKAKMTQALEVLSDIVLNSKIEAAEIEREKGVIIEELNMYEDNPMMNIEDVLENLLYGDTPAGRDTIGTKQTIKSFKRADFIDYMQKQYGASSATMVVAGNLTADLKKQLEKTFGKMKRNHFKEKEPLTEKQIAPQLSVKFKDTDQAHLAFAIRAFGSGHKDEIALKLLAIILGGSMSSRLFTEIRERRGLAYYVRSNAEFYSDSGYLNIRAGVPLAKISETIKVIIVELKKLINQPIPQLELQRAKDMVCGRVAIDLEGSDNLANWYGLQSILPKKIEAPEVFLKKLKAIKSAEIQALAKRLLVDKNLNLAMIAKVNKTQMLALKKLLHF